MNRTAGRAAALLVIDALRRQLPRGSASGP
jgi:hypothetical protein